MQKAADINRREPQDPRRILKVAPLTGGLLGIGSTAQVSFPLIVSGLYGLTGDYGTGFFVIAVPSLIAGINIMRRMPAEKPS